MNVLFDTFAWIEYFQGSEKGRKVKEILEKENILTPSVVLLELSYQLDKKNIEFKPNLEFIKNNSKIVDINENLVLKFGKVYNDMKRRVKDIGIIDVIIVTTSIHNDAKILTGDKHFKNLKNVIFLK